MKENWRDDLEVVERNYLGIIRESVEESKILLSLAEDSSFHDAIKSCCNSANLAILDDTATQEEKARINRLLQMLYYTNQAIDSLSATQRSSNNSSNISEDASDTDLASGVARFSPQNAEDTNRVQQLIMYILNCLHSSGYRRNNGECWVARYFNGVDTHSWVRVCTIQEFIYDRTQKEINFDMWSNLTRTRANLMSVVEHLQGCKDVQFPDLVKNRRVFSFRNGIYFAADDRFEPYDTLSVSASGVISAKFFDLEFHTDLGDVWQDIATPHLQSILDFQNMHPDVSKWLYVFIGRLIYEVGELDEWQIIPYLKGAACTGKSTILMRVCRNLFESADVGVLSNNIERKFGISSLSEKFIFIGPEIKADIALEQAEFQSIVSGETLQVAIKYAPSRTIDWRVPGILAGNEVPRWVDNSGSINRRIVLFEFDKHVLHGDMTLGQKLEGEMAFILLKTNRSYLEAVRLYAKNNIWTHLPSAFHAAKEELTESANSMVSYLKSGRISFDADLYIPFVDFMEGYKEYCRQTGLRAINQGEFKNHLRSMSCDIVSKTTLRYPPICGTYVSNAKFIMGADVSRNQERDTEKN
jgi:phage/plasmid-associated DNA primase